MDVVNRIGAAMAARLQALPVGARLLVGLMVIVAALSLAMLGSSPAPGPDMLLLGGDPLPPDQLPRVEAAFARAGLSDYQIDAGRVRIASDRNAAYMAAMAAADALPPNFSEILDKPLRESSPLMSRAQQEESIKIARQQALASIIQSMKGVQRAQVLYDRERKPGLAGGNNITASITVTMQRGEELQPPQVEALRKLLTGAIAGLEPRNVAVIDLGSGRSFSLDGVAPDSTPHVPAPASVGERRQVSLHDANADQPQRNMTAQTPLGSKLDAPSRAFDMAWEWVRRQARPLGMSGLALAAVVIAGAIARKRPSHVLAPAPSAEVMSATERPTWETTPAEAAAELPAAVLPKLESPLIATEQNDHASLLAAAVAPRTTRAKTRQRASLDTIVRDDPGAAARILRQWVGNTN